MSRPPIPTRPRSRYARRYVWLVVAVVGLAAAWCAFWYYAAGEIRVTLDGWRAREAKSGRLYACGDESVGGFPFRFEVDCRQVAAEFRGGSPALALTATRALLAGQVYAPTLLIGEFTGPLTIAEAGQAPSLLVNWAGAQASLRGTPAAPERLALVVDAPRVDRLAGDAQQGLLRAEHGEFHARLLDDAATGKPVIQFALEVSKASLPGVHPAAAAPFDATIVASLSGLDDFAAKPLATRLREMQAAGGRIDITRVRLQQGETLAVGDGALTLNADGKLQGELKLTVAGIESFLKAINAQEMVQKSAQMDKLAGMLDRITPGLGDAARQQAAANISAGLNLIGQPATLDGRRALILPLRIDDGAIFLGPIPLGTTPALF